MADFNNRWIYTTDTSTDPNLLTKLVLPIRWEDPVSGIKYGNLNDLSTVELNSVGWYKVMEEIPAKTVYEVHILDSRIYDDQTLEYTDTYILEYDDIETVRVIKIDSLEAEKDLTIEIELERRSLNDNLYVIYKGLATLINEFTKADPADSINNNTALQNILTKTTALAIDVNAINSRIAQAEVETDIPTLIAI